MIKEQGYTNYKCSVWALKNTALSNEYIRNYYEKYKGVINIPLWNSIMVYKAYDRIFSKTWFMKILHYLAIDEVSITFCLETERKGIKQNESFKKPGNFSVRLHFNKQGEMIRVSKFCLNNTMINQNYIFCCKKSFLFVGV